MIDTESLPPSVHSTGMTASAPAGSSAPVMILIAWPGLSLRLSVSPAATSAVTGSRTGLSGLAAATSAASTAYPSIDELSKPGIGQAASTSAASTAPSALAVVIGISSGRSGVSAATISSR